MFKSARVDSPQFGEWLERATRTLEELELHLAPSSCAEREATVRVAGRSPLRRLSLDGPLVRLHLPSHCELRALHLGPGAHLASPPVSELALAALGLAEASSVPARFPATLVSLYLDASAWSEDVFVPTLPPTLRELVLVGASASLLSKLFQSCQSFPASIRLIDCAELRVKLPSSVQLSIETSSFDVMPAFVSWFRSSKKSTQK